MMHPKKGEDHGVNNLIMMHPKKRKIKSRFQYK